MPIYSKQTKNIPHRQSYQFVFRGQVTGVGEKKEGKKKRKLFLPFVNKHSLQIWLKTNFIDARGSHPNLLMPSQTLQKIYIELESIASGNYTAEVHRDSY